ncbi:hypothetical protein [Rickettsia hoogstraalii]|uniref:hypothetical protein n=1 Tax=Rickettsia hoogstraalii TaxID=467174 RepID=UPI001E5FE53D|nr:hypothetical protein [Rickettsia hoogstraalii]
MDQFYLCHSVIYSALLHGSVFRHCEKNYAVIRRSNPVKNSDLQNFFNYFSGLPRRFAPRNDDSGIHATTPIYSRNPVKNTNKVSIFSCFSGLLILVRNNIK